MTEQRLAVILLVAIGGMFLAGCECNRAQFPDLYDNVSGADWRKAVQDCSNYCDTSSITWRSAIQDELSIFSSNVSGDDWRENVAGSCGEPAGSRTPVQSR